MSLLMNVYEKQERQRKMSLGQQCWNAKRDQDLENAVGLKCQENGVVVLTLQHIRDQDLNVKNRSVASREWCDDAKLEAPNKSRVATTKIR